MEPLITTVIPTYRRPSLLKRAIESVLEQDFKSVRVCVFDNNSGDETRSVVEDIAARDSRVMYHAHAENIGPTENFEFALKQVKTPYYSFLSDDDYLLPGFFHQALEDFAAHPDAMFWAGITVNVDENNTIWDAKVERWPDEGLFVPPLGLMRVMGGMSPTWTGILFRREVLDVIGLPDRETLGPKDLDFVLQIAARYSYFVRKMPVAVFTLNMSSFSATQPLSSFWPGWKKMFVNLERAVADYEEKDRQLARQTLHMDARRMLFRRGANAIAHGRLDFARDAAVALKVDYQLGFHALTLRAIAWLCQNSALIQKLYSSAYRLAEARIIVKRKDIKSRYAHLIR